MFELALQRAAAYTHPIVSSLRSHGGGVRALVGSLVVLNRQGWAATAAHHFEPHFLAQEHAGLASVLRQGQQADPAWIAEVGMWFGADGTSLKHLRFVPELDLAIGQLEPFDPDAIALYPTLQHPARMALGA